MHGVVVRDVGRLQIDADVVHPALAALLHLLHDDGFHLAVGQWLPLLEAQVVRSELGDLLHRVEAQLVATGEEVFDEPDDAFFLVHLRQYLSIVRFFVYFSEHLADEVQSQFLQPYVPVGAHGACLLLELCLLAVSGQCDEQLLGIRRLVVEGLRHTGVELHLDALALVVVGIPDHLSLFVGARPFV